MTLQDIFRALADPTRLRILHLLETAELHVNELVQVLDLPQPTVSRHLGILHRTSLVRRRREGPWTYYGLDRGSGALWSDGLGRAVSDRLRSLEAPGDRVRLAACLEARVRDTQAFFARMAPEWDRLRLGLDVAGLHGRILGALLPADLELVDAGTGTGALLPGLAPAARRIVAVDRSAEMLAEAARRVAALGIRPARLVRADLHRLPLADASVDGVCSLLALHHVARPEAVVHEFARIVRSGGRVVVSDLVTHQEEWMRAELAHVWLGFDPERVRAWFRAGGLDDVQVELAPRRRGSGARKVPDVWVVRGRRAAA